MNQQEQKNWNWGIIVSSNSNEESLKELFSAIKRKTVVLKDLADQPHLSP